MEGPVMNWTQMGELKNSIEKVRDDWTKEVESMEKDALDYLDNGYTGDAATKTKNKLESVISDGTNMFNAIAHDVEHELEEQIKAFKAQAEENKNSVGD